MIGHYLLTLTPPAEHDVLTGKMMPGAYNDGNGERCLVGWAADASISWKNSPTYGRFRRRQHLNAHFSPRARVEETYDGLCARFGVDRVNGAIRNRILSNIARRELAGVREAVPA